MRRARALGGTAHEAEPLMKRVRDFPKVEALQVSIAHAGDDAPARVAVQTRL